MRSIVVGDVHGCLEELHDILLLTSFHEGKDQLVLVGDLVDRGPDSAGVVRLARKLGAKAVLGNHEEKHLRYRRHEKRKLEDPSYENPMRPFTEQRLAEHRSLSEADWEWLEELPHYLHVDGPWWAIHAGAEPGLSIPEQHPNALMRLRYLKTATRKMASLTELQEAGLPDPEFTFWTELWDGKENILYGHHVHPDSPQMSIGNPLHPSPRPGGHCVGLDTGCCFGGKLSAAIIEDGKFVCTISVEARDTYHTYGGWGA